MDTLSDLLGLPRCETPAAESRLEHGCVKCLSASLYPRPLGDGTTVRLCRQHSSNLTSLFSHAGIGKRAPLTIGERQWLWRWFYRTDYFDFHRRFSRGRAKRLLTRANASGVSAVGGLPGRGGNRTVHLRPAIPSNPGSAGSNTPQRLTSFAVGPTERTA